MAKRLHGSRCHLVREIGHIVLYGDLAPPLKRGTVAPPQFSAVCCGQTAGWIKISLGTEVGLGPGHIVLDGDPPRPNGHSPNFRSMCCGQRAGWIKMPLGTEVCLGPGDTVLDGDPAPLTGAHYPHFWTHAFFGRVPPLLDPCFLWANG